MIAERIHVVVTGRNTAPWANACIESLRAQSFRCFACVVVDHPPAADEALEGWFVTVDAGHPAGRVQGVEEPALG